MKQLFNFLLLSVCITTTSIAGAESLKNIDLFSQLIELAEKNDASERQGAQGDFIRYLAHIVPEDEAQPRTADYFTLRGVKDGTDFHATHVNLVSEKFSLNADNNWVIDQWIFSLSLGGHIIEFSHKTMVKTQEGIIVDINFIEETQEAAAEFLTHKLQEWFSRIPKMNIELLSCKTPSPFCIDV